MEFNVNKQSYLKWLETTIAAIDMMSTDEVLHRIQEVQETEFFSQREYNMLQKELDKRALRAGKKEK